MGEWTGGWLAAGSAAGLVVALTVGLLLFHAGCALADVREPGWLQSLGVFAAALLLCVPLAWGLWWLAGRYEADSSSLLGPWRLGALALALPLAWLVSAGVYSLLLTAPLRKGLVIAGAEFVLGALLAALGSGVVLVVLAIVQINHQPPPRAVSATPPAFAGLPPS